jgi:Glutamyl-tRNA reductase
MGRRAVSVSSAALELARSQVGALNNLNVAVVGAGRMAQICVKLLLSEDGTGKVNLLNRSPERLAEFVKNNLPNLQRLNTGTSFDDRYEAAAKADLVIVSTSAPKTILDMEELNAARQKHGKKPTCIIDISVPRNVDPAVQEIEDVSLFNSDALANIVTRNLEEREACIAGAEAIVFEGLDAFHGWQRSQLVGPTIAELREKIESIRLDVAMRLPAGSFENSRLSLESSTSRGSFLSKTAARQRLGGMSVGKSFKLWTTRSTSSRKKSFFQFFNEHAASAQFCYRTVENFVALCT